MKYLLHIDTATDTGIVALAGDGQILSVRENKESRNHAANINNMINDVLADAGCTLNAVDALAICGGPGSYTGLRIGMATAKGICYALDRPLIMTDKLTLLAFDARSKQQSSYTQFISLLTAREKEYFIAVYDADFNKIVAPQHILEAGISHLIKKEENTHITTDSSEEILNYLSVNRLDVDRNTSIGLDSWAQYAIEQLECNNSVNLASAEPIYLKQVYTHK